MNPIVWFHQWLCLHTCPSNEQGLETSTITCDRLECCDPPRPYQQQHSGSGGKKGVWWPCNQWHRYGNSFTHTNTYTYTHTHTHQYTYQQWKYQTNETLTLWRQLLPSLSTSMGFAPWESNKFIISTWPQYAALWRHVDFMELARAFTSADLSINSFAT